MKKVFIGLITIIFIACSSDKNKVKDKIEPKKSVESINVPKFDFWSRKNIKLELSEIQFNQKSTYSLRRTESLESSFIQTPFIEVDYDEFYKVSIIVKASESTSIFGLRMSAYYPDRSDAIFDLKKGEVIGSKSSQDFKNEVASIEHLENGWYRCSLQALVSDVDLSLLFGPTNGKNSIDGWEGKTLESGEIYVIPSSLTLEKIITQ